MPCGLIRAKLFPEMCLIVNSTQGNKINFKFPIRNIHLKLPTAEHSQICACQIVASLLFCIRPLEISKSILIGINFQTGQLDNVQTPRQLLCSSGDSVAASELQSVSLSNFACNSNLMGNFHCWNFTTGNQSAPFSSTCHESIAVVSRTKFEAITLLVECKSNFSSHFEFGLKYR